MRKRGFGLLLAVVMVVFLLPVDAGAFSNIDLSRVKFSTGKEKLLFEFGNVSIEGELQQIHPFTKEEIDKIVQDTLRATGLTELDIKEANDKVEKARRASEFTKEDMERIKQNLLTTAEVTPVPGDAVTIVKVIDKYMSTTSWDDIGTASADLLEQAMTEQVKETASGFLDRAGELGENVNLANEWLGALNSIISFCEMLADEQAHTRQKWQDIADGANAKRLLNNFYEALQDGIENYKQKSDKAGWRIVFDEAVDKRTFSFFGVDDNHQYWYLNMKLQQINTNEYGSVAGDYEGDYIISVEHQMTGFKTRSDEVLRHLDGFKDTINKMLTTKDADAKLTPTGGSAFISRTISGDCEVTIMESGSITMTLSQKDDKTDVSISTSAVLTLSFDGGENIYNEGKMPFQLTAEEETLKVSGMTFKITGKSQLSLGQNFEFANTLGGGGTVEVGWDENIWKPWNGTQKTLKFAGE